MAKETVVRLIDDLDGTQAATSICFSWNDVAYEIDLSSKNARAFEAAIGPYVKAATRIGSARARRATKTTSRPEKHNLAAIREWANANGHTVGDRGRIPNAIVEAYTASREAATGSAAPSPARPARRATKRTATRRTPIKKTASPATRKTAK